MQTRGTSGCMHTAASSPDHGTILPGVWKSVSLLPHEGLKGCMTLLGASVERACCDPMLMAEV